MCRCIRKPTANLLLILNRRAELRAAASETGLLRDGAARPGKTAEDGNGGSVCALSAGGKVENTHESEAFDPLLAALLLFSAVPWRNPLKEG